VYLKFFLPIFARIFFQDKYLEAKSLIIYWILDKMQIKINERTIVLDEWNYFPKKKIIGVNFEIVMTIFNHKIVAIHSIIQVRPPARTLHLEFDSCTVQAKPARVVTLARESKQFPPK
jgi:hypothetical protein